MGENRRRDFETIKSDELAKKITCKTIMLVGSNEGKEVRISNNRIYRLLKGDKDYQVINGPKHDIVDPDYQNKIADVINQFLI